MKFSKEEINAGIVIAFCGKSQIARSADEAKAVIESFGLQVNNYATKYLSELFKGEEVAERVRTAGCGPNDIRFYPTLAPTIEEHNRLYREEKEKRRLEAVARKEKEDEELRKLMMVPRKAVYHVEAEVTAWDCRWAHKRYMVCSAECVAESAWNAYQKFVPTEVEKICRERGCELLHCGTPFDNGVRTWVVRDL